MIDHPALCMTACLLFDHVEGVGVHLHRGGKNTRITCSAGRGQNTGVKRDFLDEIVKGT